MNEASRRVAAARPVSRPTTSAERITSLDMIRGVAILGILPMNAVVFGLADTAYFNVSADGVEQPLDWIIGVLSMVFVDQKMMGLFSLLFGVGVVIFAERAAASHRRGVWLSLWRFALLFALGVAHAALWFGDVLALYAMCAPIVLLVRTLPARILAGAGSVLALTGTVLAPFVQARVGTDGAHLGDYWLVGAGAKSAEVETWFLLNAGGRALGLMLIGVALYRLGIVQGERDNAYYRHLAAWGIGVGTAVTAVGSVLYIATDWSADYALIGTVPTGLGTIPMVLGYMAAVILWNRSGSRHLECFRNAGRMALTNYLTQTVIGLATLGWLLADVELTRTMIAVWILAVWSLQLWWSTWWLERFRYGPFEWAWRCGTYRSWQPLRRPNA
ncbi:MAG: DUF418 domain-containing protein [Ornithinimicrobium sp.]